MILAGEIGATRTRLAAYETEGNRLNCVVQKNYPSHEYASLAEILPLFTRREGIGVHSACFGVAGPVRAGRSKISNLPWTIDCKELATQLKLPTVGLLNDLEAYAYGVDALGRSCSYGYRYNQKPSTRRAHKNPSPSRLVLASTVGRDAAYGWQGRGPLALQ